MSSNTTNKENAAIIYSNVFDIYMEDKFIVLVFKSMEPGTDEVGIAINPSAFKILCSAMYDNVKWYEARYAKISSNLEPAKVEKITQKE